jgi:hypothetical protein
MVNKVILDQNLNAGLKKVPQETRQRNLNCHAEGLTTSTAGKSNSLWDVTLMCTIPCGEAPALTQEESAL